MSELLWVENVDNNKAYVCSKCQGCVTRIELYFDESDVFGWVCTSCNDEFDEYNLHLEIQKESR